MGLLLEMDDGLMVDWVVVKWREWSDEGSSAARPVSARRLEEPLPARKEETQSLLESSSAPIYVVKGPSCASTLEELTQMVQDL